MREKPRIYWGFHAFVTAHFPDHPQTTHPSMRLVASGTGLFDPLARQNRTLIPVRQICHSRHFLCTVRPPLALMPSDHSLLSTVVGYQEVGVPSGFSMRTSTFKAINGSYKISDIKVAGAEGAGSDSIQKINADGSWGDMYYYYTLDGSGWLEDGWYLEDGVTPVSDTDVIGVGEAFMVTSASDISFTFAGEVMNSNPEVDVPAGFSMVGNPTPVTVKISQIGVTGADGAGSDSIQKINADGSWGDMYYYYTLDGSGWLEDGWYLEDGATPVSDTDVLEAGESIMFTSSSGLKATFPKAL